MSNAAIWASEHFNGDTNGGGYNNTAVALDDITTTNSWFSSVNTGGGVTTLQFANASARGSHSAKYECAVGGSANPFADIDFTGTSAYVVWEAYYRFSADALAPTANYQITQARDGATNRCHIQITQPTPYLRIRNGNTAVDTGTYALTNGDWYRIAYEIDITNSTQNLYLYADNDLHNDPTGYTELLTGTYNQGQISYFRTGFVTTPGLQCSFNIDEPVISFEGLVGPSYGAFNGAGVPGVAENIAYT
jgi:hypothetical protein